jgi:1-acyl-sn-glycerol-3-phosphate acyltransferase
VGASGIELTVRGCINNEVTNVVCFSHASTLDAFTGSAALPAPSLAVSKKELFLIPFFAW